MQATRRVGLFFLLALSAWAVDPITNQRVVFDMVQNNPGDPVGWQPSKFVEPLVLKEAGYTGQCTTGEMSGTQAVDFSSTGHDFFPAGSAQRAWLDAYSKGVSRFVDSAKNEGLSVYFFVDLLVFPTPVLEAWPNSTDGKGKVLWNDASRQLLEMMADELFEKFPGCDGWVVRTGETYTYDTPWHKGNSPSNGTMDRWVEFITELRRVVCEKHGKQLFFRSWDNWPSTADYYLNMTNQIQPHSLLYFSIKHSAADFVRPAVWNPQLGIGQHAQIVEVELQREYEGKGAYPNYVMDGVIDGFPEMSAPIGLQHIKDAPQLKGLWTWTRGGGWWGPYIHAREQWIELHVKVLLGWWNAGDNSTEAQVFARVTPEILPGCTSEQCTSAFRNFSRSAAEVVLHGQWGLVSNCGTWMRDDRIGGVDQVSGCMSALGTSDDKWQASRDEKNSARAQSIANLNLYEASIKPHVTDKTLAEVVSVSAEYAVHLYSVVAAGWPLLQQAWRVGHNMSAFLNQTELVSAIADYDSAIGGFRAYGLGEQYAPSLYHPYYLCLGTTCNGAFDPPSADLQAGSIQGKDAYGIGQTVDGLRAR